MHIGQLAKRTNLTADIRFYEKRLLLPKPSRTAGRFRLYGTEDIERLCFIRQMHGLGFSLREIRDLADLRAHRVASCESVRNLLQKKLADVRRKVHELEKLECELVNDLKKCSKELRHRKQHAARACPVLQGEDSN